MKRWFIVALSCLALTTLVACEKEGGDDEKSEEESGPAVDAWDESALEDGSEQTMNLKFWMTGMCYDGDTRGTCAHFDAAENERVVFFHSEDVGDGAEWKQNEVYAVTFQYDTPKESDPMRKGVLTKVE